MMHPHPLNTAIRAALIVVVLSIAPVVIAVALSQPHPNLPSVDLASLLLRLLATLAHTGWLVTLWVSYRLVKARNATKAAHRTIAHLGAELAQADRTIAHLCTELAHAEYECCCCCDAALDDALHTEGYDVIEVPWERVRDVPSAPRAQAMTATVLDLEGMRQRGVRLAPRAQATTLTVLDLEQMAPGQAPDAAVPGYDLY